MRMLSAPTVFAMNKLHWWRFLLVGLVFMDKVSPQVFSPQHYGSPGNHGILENGNGNPWNDPGNRSFSEDQTRTGLYNDQIFGQTYQGPMVYRQVDHMPKYKTFDFVIVGSGSGGSALANRLSENPIWNILLLEVGEQPSFLTNIPAICAIFQQTQFNWGYLMEPQENMCLGLKGRRMAWPRGRALGGSSVINYMMAVRGNRGDFDRWAAMGNPGWSYEDVLPYFKKLEDCSVKYTDSEYHNRGGPVAVQDVPYRTKMVDIFIQASSEAGHNFLDYNGKDQLGVSYIQGTTRNGLRASAEASYLRPIRNRPNLTILTKARATKVILDDNLRATAVEYVRNRQYHYANVTKEVILSTGTFNTPQLLMLSGIGPKDHLEELGIPVRKPLPVGKKLFDHATFVGLTFTINESLSYVFEEMNDPNNFLKLLQGYGSLTSLGGVEAAAFLKTNVSREPDDYPDIEFILLSGSFATDYGILYRQTYRISDEIYNTIWKPLEKIKENTWSVFVMVLHPLSSGMVRLKSKNPYHWPRLYGNFMTDPEKMDIKTFIAGIREVQKINNSPTFQRYNSKQVTTKIPGCDHLEWDTDEYWECALRHVTGSIHHQIGTAKMGPSTDPEAVVDQRLKVHGIQGLRVVDASIIPLQLAAHTHLPTMMVGEKAGDLIKEDWGQL